VLGEGGDKVIQLLKGNELLMKSSTFVHSYPYDWRSKTPVILRASKQWFIDVSALKKDALECLNQVFQVSVQILNTWNFNV
jgi:isoleucyl-tRNA synthetase